jgi:RHS repeat-associated protein
MLIQGSFSRLTRVFKTPSSPVLVGEYSYDAGGRRIRKVISNGGLSGTIANGTIDYLYDGLQCVEERDGSNNAQSAYVWGTYIDELLLLAVDINTTTRIHLPLQDLNYRTTALLDPSGNLDEAYDYDPYGNTLIFNAIGTGGWWADDATQTKQPTCDYLWTGRRYDPETEIYYFRARYYGPTLGRFLSEDPLGYVDGMNLYRGYFLPRYVDPSGTSISVRFASGLASTMGRAFHSLHGILDFEATDEAGRNCCFREMGVVHLALVILLFPEIVY